MAYRDIVFLQGDEATEALEILEEEGEQAALDYLVSTYDQDEGEVRYDEPWGGEDENFQDGDWIMTYNTRLGYIGLVEEISEEEAEESEEEAEEAEGPAPDDFVIDDSARGGWGLGRHEGKYIDTFSDWDDMMRTIKETMEREKFWPNVWEISDHGNLRLVAPDELDVPEEEAEEAEEDED